MKVQNKAPAFFYGTSALHGAAAIESVLKTFGLTHPSICSPGNYRLAN